RGTSGYACGPCSTGRGSSRSGTSSRRRSRWPKRPSPWPPTTGGPRDCATTWPTSSRRPGARAGRCARPTPPPRRRPPPPGLPSATAPPRSSPPRERLGRDDLPAAKEAVDQALALVPGDAEARTLQERVQAREREVVVGRVRAALDAADPVAAQAALIRLAAVTPQHPELPALRARLTEVRDRVVREALAEADKGLRDGALDRLSAALGRVRAVAPDHPQLAKLEAQAQR